MFGRKRKTEKETLNKEVVQAETEDALYNLIAQKRLEIMKKDDRMFNRHDFSAGRRL